MKTDFSIYRDDADLYQVTAENFCAGFIMRRGRVATCAPILRYMKGWTLGEARLYCSNRGWDLKLVPTGVMRLVKRKRAQRPPLFLLTEGTEH